MKNGVNCPSCGFKRGHHVNCNQKRNPGEKPKRLPRWNLAKSRMWYRLFHTQPTMISTNGAQVMAYLLDEITRLRMLIKEK